MRHELHCIQLGLCLSFLSFSPPAEPTCHLPLLAIFGAPSHMLCHDRWSAFLPPNRVDSCICQSFHQRLHHPHCRAFSGSLFSSVKLGFPFLHVSQTLWLLQFLIWAPYLSLSILLAGSKFILSQASWACFKLGTHLVPLPHIPASPTTTLYGHLLNLPPLTFLYFQVSYLPLVIMPMLSRSLLYFYSILTLSMCVCTSSVTTSCSIHFCSFLSLHTPPLCDTCSLTPDISSPVFIFTDFYITIKKLSL